MIARTWTTMPMRQPIVFGLFILSWLFTLAGCDNSQPQVPVKKPVTGLVTAPVVEVVIPRWVRLNGNVEALNQATISAQTSGRVTELAFDVGDYVAKGQRVITITNTQQSALLKSAQSQVTEAKVRADEAERAFDRAKGVFDKKLISQADFDKTTSERNAALARLATAQANVKNTEQNLAYTRIDAPYAGIVLERHVQVGEAVAPGTPLVTGLSLEQLRVVVNVPQAYLSALRQQGSAQVFFGNAAPIVVDQIRYPPGADSASHSFKVLLTLPKTDYVDLPDAAALPGTSVKVQFKTGEYTAVLVPRKSLVQRGEITSVYVVNADGIINLRYLHIGADHPGTESLGPETLGAEYIGADAGDAVEVLAGINVGEIIALEPLAAALAYQQQNLNTPSAEAAHE